MPSVFLNDLDKIISEVSQYQDKIEKVGEFYNQMGRAAWETFAKPETVVIFDFSGSTSLKLKIGHELAMRKIVLHDKICRIIIKKLNGEVIKETGDGVVALFANPLDACRAAINTLEIAVRKEIPTKASLVFGMFEKIKLASKIDVYGLSMDTCARIEKCALENQILINSALHNAILPFLKDYDDVLVSEPIPVTLRGIPDKEIYEIASKHIGLQNTIATESKKNRYKRFAINEKIELIRNAESEIIEVGFGFQEFINHFGNFTGLGDFIKRLLKKGVNIKFLIVDPNWGLEELKTTEEALAEKCRILKNHLILLRELQTELDVKKLQGNLEIHLYRKFPLFQALCIDSDLDGRIIVSNHLHGIEESENIEIMISKTSDPLMFDSYRSSIKLLFKNSQVLKLSINTNQKAMT